jgi:60 kDa SS-A/Ro ribonucleoprotein
MSKLNVAVKADPVFTSEGAPAARIGPEQELRRTVAACLLWESGFYESGASIADRIKALVPKCRPEFVAACAFEARTKMKLRHVPLLIVAVMAGTVPHAGLVAKLLPDVIQRADELAEFVAIYANVNGVAPGAVKKKLSAQVKAGLAKAFQRFDEYALAKYDRDGAVKLRDVLFMVHAKPKDAEQDALWRRLIDGKLASPETWENRLSRGEDKKLTFERMMAEGELGALAFLRNLRNMREAGVSEDLIVGYASAVNIARVLPFRFIAAARAVPAYEHILEPMMLRACEGREKLPGRTVVLLDVSGSMDAPVSAKSDIQRIDAACGVAILLRELCESVEVLTFSNSVVQVAPRRGFALRDAIVTSQPHGGTYMGKAVEGVNHLREYDRMVVLTDEQSHDRVPNPKGKGYVINVASNKNGVGYGAWGHIDGWSESCIDYIQELERVSAT